MKYPDSWVIIKPIMSGLKSSTTLLIIILIIVFSRTCLAQESPMDVIPKGFMADRSTPYAIHFSLATSALAGYSKVTAKIRVNAGCQANNFTWCTTAPGWRADDAVLGILPILTVSNSTVCGWLVGKSTSSSFYGPGTCTIRLYKTNSQFIEIISTTFFYSWNSTSDAGWIEGTFPGYNSKLVLAYSNQELVGSYMSEPNGINEGYQNSNGYFKIAVPVGIVDLLEFRDTNNNVLYQKTGSWTIQPNTVTTLPAAASVPSNYWPAN